MTDERDPSASASTKPKLKYLPRKYPKRRNEAERLQLQEEQRRQQQQQAEEIQKIERDRRRQQCHEHKHYETYKHNRHNCPNLPCHYCKMEGHMAPNCPKARKKDSEALKRRQSVENPRTNETKRQETLERRRGAPLIRGYPPSFECPGIPLDEQEASEEKDAIYPTPTFTFPYLKIEMLHLVEKLMNNQSPDIKNMNYPKLFNDCGVSPSHLIETAMEMIEPEVKKLQGLTLTPELFRKAYEDQFERTLGQPWPKIGGYADGVLDDRDPKYARYYIGQSGHLDRRIFKEHAECIRNSNVESLHYFTLAHGDGHRRAHFLRLWHASPLLTDSPEEKIRDLLLQNLLEMTFCRAFESLPPPVLTEYFGKGNYTDVGLNNLLPLVQGKRVAKWLLTKYLDYHKQSSDPDVITFTKIRPKQIAAKRQTNMKGSKAVFTRDYKRAMNQLLQSLELNVDSIADLTTAAAHVESIDIPNGLQKLPLNNGGPFVAPIGSYSAKVGVVMDSEAEIDGDQSSAEPLKTVRLGKDNTLIWTSSFEGLGNGPSRFKAGSAEKLELDYFNYLTIMGSGLRVIILCGLRTRNDVLASFKRNPFVPIVQPRYELLGPYHLPLEGNSPAIWLLCHRKDVTRVLITSPESPELSTKKYSTETLRGFRDAFGIAATLTGEKIKYTHWEQTCFYAALRAQARLENAGLVEPLTASTMPPIFRNWLLYKRFTDDDILELEDKAESFTLGLVQITSIIGYKVKIKSRYSTGINNPLIRLRGYRGAYNEANFKSVKALLERVSTQPYKTSSQDEPDHNTTAEQIEEDDEPLVERMSEVITESIELAEEQNDDGMDLLSPELIPRISDELKAKFQAMLTEDGILRKVKKDRQWWRLPLSLHLFSFTVDEDAEALINLNAIFAIRASLSEPGTTHPNCVLQDFQLCVPDDPCLRLALQYRLVDNHDGKGPSETWKWAHKRKPWRIEKVEKVGEKGRNEAQFVFKLNALVELMEGKDICDIFYTPRRWITYDDQITAMRQNMLTE